MDGCSVHHAGVTRSAVVEALRAQLRARAPFIDREAGVPTGVAELDAWLRGLPAGGITVLSGPLGGGCTELAARVLAGRARAGAPVAWVDATRTLYPPALVQAGIDPARLLLVRPAAERAFFAYEQILESGLFAAAVASGLDAGLTPARARRVQQAAETGRGLALMILRTAADRLPGAVLRLAVQGRAGAGRLRVAVENDRRGRPRGPTRVLALGP